MGGNKHQQMSQDKPKDLNNQEDETTNASNPELEMEEDWEDTTSTRGELGGETPDLYNLDEEEDEVTSDSPSPLLSDEEAFKSVDDEGGKI